MKIAAIINVQGGSLRGMDQTRFRAHINDRFGAAGHSVGIEVVSPGDLEKALARAGESDADAILAGGGDGTIASAARTCIRSEKVLGVLPGGTMNLFARSLQVPLDPMLAVNALAYAQPGRSDFGTANGRLFLHQYSVGMQPALVRKRSKYNYRSRIGKILAGLRAAAEMVSAPPVFECEYMLDDTKRTAKLSMIAVSNNMHAEGHLPYPDRLDGHVLGVYSCAPISTSASAKLVSDLLLGNWSKNPDLVVESAKQANLRFIRTKRSQKALIDGELVGLEKEVELKIHAGGLKVLKPVKSPDDA